MPDVLAALLLGTTQGLTEFLPVSSSGHLLLGQYFLGVDADRFGLPFDAALHLGTLTAVVSFFRADLLGMVRAVALSPRSTTLGTPDGRLACLVAASSIPAAAIGYLLEDFFNSSARSPWVVASCLALVGVLMIAGEAIGRGTRTAPGLTLSEAVWVGFAQAAALVPGVSRSGATITLGLFFGLRREEAARFSFLMGVPIILGASLLELSRLVADGLDPRDGLLFGVGMLSSAAVGYLAIRFFIDYLTRHSLRIFAY